MCFISFIKFQSSLGKILTNLSEESFDGDEENDKEEGESSLPLPTTNSDVSMTEELVSRNYRSNSNGDDLKSTTTASNTKKSTAGKSGLSQTISFDEDETSSTVSFDSDGLPVRRSKSTRQGIYFYVQEMERKATSVFSINYPLGTD